VQTIALADVTGAQYWSLICTSTDETTTPATVNASLVVNLVAKTATFTAPAAGSAAIFTSTVGVSALGRDANGTLVPAYTATFKVYAGTEVVCANETTETDSNAGWNAILNPLLRTGPGASTSIAGTAGTAPITCANLTWSQGVTAPTLGQTTQAVGAAPQSIKLAPQAPNAGAAGANQIAGSLVVDLAAPAGAGTTEAHFTVSRAGLPLFHVGAFDGFPTSFANIWAGPSITPTTSNYLFLADGIFNSYLNVPNAAGAVTIVIGGANTNAGSVAFNAASGMVFSAASTNPRISQTVQATTGVQLTLQAANVTTGTGSDAAVTSGTGSVASGNVLLQTGTTTRVTVSPTAVTSTLRMSAPRFTGSVSALSYSASITPDSSLGEFFTLGITNTSAFTINAPTNPIAGARMTIDLLNSSGGAHGTITWNAAFSMAGALAAIASTKRKTISFYYSGSNWIELNRAAADI